MSKITVEVSGPAGVGKSAIAQLIAMYLSKVELKATNDLNTDLRSMDDLQLAVDFIIANKMHIEIIEKTVPAEVNASTEAEDDEDDEDPVSWDDDATTLTPLHLVRLELKELHAQQDKMQRKLDETKQKASTAWGLAVVSLLVLGITLAVSAVRF